MGQLRLLFYMAGVVLSTSLVSCSTPASLQRTTPVVLNRATPLPVVPPLPQDKVAMGQTVYVPIYSHIYHYNSQEHRVNLSATLSIRNTDLTHAIIVNSVRYYNTEGQLVRQDIERPIQLNPLASTSFFIAADDTSGGSGANYIVEWVADKKVSEPVIEAIMISTSSSQGISFISAAKVIKQQGLQN